MSRCGWKECGFRPAGRPWTCSRRPASIVGLAGLAGAGHHDLLGLIAGLARSGTGRILLPDGTPVRGPRRAAVAAGVALVSGDRRRVGLMLDKPLWENIAQVRTVALGRDGLLVRRPELRRRAREQIRRLGVRTRSADTPAGALSGGNQQKIVFAKWLELEPAVLLLDDPTRGVDIGAKREMHAMIRAMADAGAVVILCSTDNQELAELCDRVAVFYQGAMVGELSGARLDEHELLEAVNTGSRSGGGMSESSACSPRAVRVRRRPPPGPGRYDLHVHVAPDVMRRRINDVDLARRVRGLGLAGFVLKSHYVSTAERAAVVNAAVPGCGHWARSRLNSAGGRAQPDGGRDRRPGGRAGGLDADRGRGEPPAHGRDLPPGATPPMWLELQDDLRRRGLDAAAGRGARRRRQRAAATRAVLSSSPSTAWCSPPATWAGARSSP